MDTTTKEQTELEQFQSLRIEALETECKRLNECLAKIRNEVLQARISDPVFLHPLIALPERVKDMEVNFESNSQH